jgi:spoIIIJ-associated protein
MIAKEDITIIQKEVKTLFEKLGVEGDLRVEQKEEDRTIVVSLQVEDPKLLIGEKGQTLFEIQHLLKLIIRKKLPSLIGQYISLDINEYKKNKEEYLQDLAKTAADEVAILKKPKELAPMPASERRIIHSVLSERSDVTSESIGEDPDRRIVIKINTKG